MQELNIDVASEFLVIAAQLIYSIAGALPPDPMRSGKKRKIHVQARTPAARIRAIQERRRDAASARADRECGMVETQAGRDGRIGLSPNWQ
jgi:chromatin segregation and condensation protein Rec8/ScpA/Scc1 (kleisin family)